MHRLFAGICLGLISFTSQAALAQETQEQRKEETRNSRERPEAGATVMDDLDLRELEFQIQQREQSLPMLWSTIFNFESQQGDEETEREIARLKQRSEQVKNEIRQLRAERERNAPKPASPTDARKRAAEHLRMAEEILAESGDGATESIALRAFRTRLESDRESTPSRGFERTPARSFGTPFQSESSTRVPEELMERIRAASPERFERRINEQAETIKRLQEQVERLQEELEERQESQIEAEQEE